MPFSGASASGQAARIFDSTLGSDQASIDSGAGSIPGGYYALLVYITVRTADAAATGGITVTVNNDTSAIYDTQRISGINATPGSGVTNADTGWKSTAHGSGGSATYPSVWQIWLPLYDQTTFWKVATMLAVVPDATAANQAASTFGLGYRATTAVSRIAVTGQTANLKTGSRLTIFGT